MPVTIVVGGQYGSEGKGKTAALLARQCREPWVVRCGGPNSGHTTNVGGREVVLRQLPAAAGQPDAMLFLSAGCVVSEEILIREIKACGLERDRVVVDSRAVLVTEVDVLAEQALSESIGSTASGTGQALVRRMLRGPGAQLATHSKILRDFARIETVAPLLHDHTEKGGSVIVEGTQGFGLSILHGPDYPYVTSRDTTASGFATEVGLSPRDVDEIVMVVRTFPIRVAGNSGPLPREITWQRVKEIGGAPDVSTELTSVTQKVRRVAEFDLELVRNACSYNRPTALAVMGLDRLDYENFRCQEQYELSSAARDFLSTLDSALLIPVRLAGTGFGTFDAIHLSKSTLSSFSADVR